MSCSAELHYPVYTYIIQQAHEASSRLTGPRSQPKHRLEETFKGHSGDPFEGKMRATMRKCGSKSQRQVDRK